MADVLQSRAITVSSKGLCDVFCPNSLYAKVGGISISELNVLEREFLQMIDWRLTVSTFFFLPPPIIYHATWAKFTFNLASNQCRRELLQEYYFNLVRTNTSDRFVIIGPQQQPTSPIIPVENDVDMDASSSRTPSTVTEPSAILIDPSTIPQDTTRRPTIEQNMAFASWTDEAERLNNQRTLS
ncbi:Pho80p cyclin [Paramarasmius palmivorus]|uniref:Pho80p cyclin n=1 Tax=Paramarasmius palmivorus TaxID=297713 RepID=A0AAW0C9G6_9AGAR